MPQLRPGAREPQSRYPFDKYLNNQDLFRPRIFKKYCLEWSLWRPMEHLVDQFEKIERAGGAGRLELRRGDDINIMGLLQKRCSRTEMHKVETMIRMGRVKEELANAFCVEYRKAYPKALERARADFVRSDFLHEWEFFAVKFALVPRATPYAKRPRGKLVVQLDKVYMHRSQRR